MKPLNKKKERGKSPQKNLKNTPKKQIPKIYTPEEIGKMTAKEYADYIGDLFVYNLNNNMTKD